MVVNGDGQLLLGAVLADDVAVEKLFDLGRAGQAAGETRRLRGSLAQKALGDAFQYVA